MAIVAESEGTLVVTAYLVDHPEAPVDRLMLLSPIVDPGRATYPDPGEEGFGVVAGYELRVVTGLIDAMAPFVISADGPLTDSVRREASDLRGEAVCDRPAIEEVVVLPLADAVTAPAGQDPAVEEIVVPGFHGGLRGRPDIQEMIRRWVLGADLEGSEVWAAVGAGHHGHRLGLAGARPGKVQRRGAAARRRAEPAAPAGGRQPAPAVKVAGLEAPALELGREAWRDAAHLG